MMRSIQIKTKITSYKNNSNKTGSNKHNELKFTQQTHRRPDILYPDLFNRVLCTGFRYQSLHINDHILPSQHNRLARRLSRQKNEPTISLRRIFRSRRR